MSENTAVSVYDAGNAMDDFPVLKAFQQYIDAEQAKAQKRMLFLCCDTFYCNWCVCRAFDGRLAAQQCAQ